MSIKRATNNIMPIVAGFIVGIGFLGLIVATDYKIQEHDAAMQHLYENMTDLHQEVETLKGMMDSLSFEIENLKYKE